LYKSQRTAGSSIFTLTLINSPPRDPQLFKMVVIIYYYWSLTYKHETHT